MARYERRPELDAPAHLHPVDNVNADPIGEGQQVRIDGDVRKHAVWTSSWQEVGRCEAISEEHDRERPIVLTRHPAEPLGARARRVDGPGPFPLVRGFVL